MVLLGDAMHTAHFSIGSGTKLAMEDAIALASALEQHTDLETALNEYELERKPVVEVFQRAAQESQAYFETLKRYLVLDPMQFTFQLLTRSGRISYDDLRLRDPRFGDAVDRWCMQKASDTEVIVAPPPMFTPLNLGELALPNRLVVSPSISGSANDGSPDEKSADCIIHYTLGGIGLVMTGQIAISAEGRISPDSLGMYTEEQRSAWAWLVTSVHTHSTAKVGIEIGHAGRRGSTRPRTEGLDRPLRQGNWPLLSASPLPYTPWSQVPKEMDRTAMECVRDQFVCTAQAAQEAGFDLLQLNMAHGYLLASFLSPLTNRRNDEYGGDLQSRMRYPLEVFDAVRTVWPEHKPLSVTVSATDCVRGGFAVEDAVVVARVLKAHGCDLVMVVAGQTTLDSEPTYGRGFLTPLSDRIRNEAGIPTMVGGYLTTSNEINTIIAAGRADLCILDSGDW
jgi:anthraniloyl-CoA monooxygenase